MLIKTFRHKKMVHQFVRMYECCIIDDEFLLISDCRDNNHNIDYSSITYIENEDFIKIEKIHYDNMDDSHEKFDLIVKTKYAYIKRDRSRRYTVIINNAPIAYFYDSSDRDYYYHRMVGRTIITNKKHILCIKDLINAT